MKKIAIFQTNLKVGGIQRSFVSLLKLLGERGDISADVFLNDAQEAFFDLPSYDNIRVYDLGGLPYLVRFIPFSLCFKLFSGSIRERIREVTGQDPEDYDAALDFDSYQMATAIGALSVKSSRRICWVHNDVLIKYRSEWKYRILHFFFRSKYTFFNKMAMVSKGIVPSFYKLNPKVTKNYEIVNNAIDIEAVMSRRGEALPGFGQDPKRIEIVSMGRLIYQKGFEELIGHIKNIALKRTDKEIHFTIIGDGPDREKLESSAMEIGAYITFTGYLRDPFSVMRQADAYVSCSRYEGQPLALMEAKLLGLPVIIPRSLEAYTEGLIKGCDDVQAALMGVKKREDREGEGGWAYNYNEGVRSSFYRLINE